MDVGCSQARSSIQSPLKCKVWILPFFLLLSSPSLLPDDFCCFTSQQELKQGVFLSLYQNKSKINLFCHRNRKVIVKIQNTGVILLKKTQKFLFKSRNHFGRNWISSNFGRTHLKFTLTSNFSLTWVKNWMKFYFGEGGLISFRFDGPNENFRKFHPNETKFSTMDRISLFLCFNCCAHAFYLKFSAVN